MTAKVKQVLTIMILTGFIISIFTAPAYAHRMLVRPIEPGLVQVVYDDGTVSGRAQVTLYDENDEEIYQGNVNEEGYFEYDTSLGPVLIVADDGVGHRAQWTVGEEVEEEASMALKVTLTVSALVFVAAVFQYKNNKKK